MSFFADVHLQKHRLELKYSVSKSSFSGVAFLRAPLWRALYMPPPSSSLPLNFWDLSLHLSSLADIKWSYSLFVYQKGKKVERSRGSHLTFATRRIWGKAETSISRTSHIFLKVLSWYGFPCWVLSQISGQCWELIQIIRAHFVPGCVSAIWIPTSFNLQDRNEWNCNWGDCKSLVGCCELILISRARFVPDHWSWMDVSSLKV